MADVEVEAVEEMADSEADVDVEVPRKGKARRWPFVVVLLKIHQASICDAGQRPTDPDPKITAAEDALVKQTAGKMIDGFPGRSGYGTKGRKIVLRTNYFTLTTAFEQNQPEVALYKYEIEMGQELSRPKTRRLFDILLTHPAFQDCNWATDYSKILVTTKKMDVEKLMADPKFKKVTLPPEDGNSQQPASNSGPAPDFVRQARDRNTFDVRITYQNSYAPRELIQYLQSSSAGAAYEGRTDLVQVLNIIMAKAPNSANQVRKAGQNNFYPYGTHPGRQFQDLGKGLEALRGYYASVRPAVNRLLVNLNVTSGAFFKSMPLVQLVREFNGNNEQNEAFLRMLKVRADYVKDGQGKPFMSKTKTIVGFAKSVEDKFTVKRCGNAHEIKFSYVDRAMPNPQPRQVTVNDYFRQHHGITLKQPNLPVLNVGTRNDPQYLPPELCFVLPGQPYRRLLSGDQTTEMLRFAARPPNLNAMSIAGTADAPGNGLRIFRLSAPAGEPNPQANSVHPFGFRVGTSMISVPGRILDTPKIKYGSSDARVNKGSWNCADQKFVRPGKFNRWQVLIINRQGNRGNALIESPQGDMLAPENLIKTLEGYLKAYGINMGARGPTERIMLDQLTFQNRQSNDRTLKQAFAKAEENRVDMLFIILPEADKWLYARIKYFGDIDHGIGSICSVGSKLQKPGGQGMYMGNLALKFNLKGNGVSHSVPNTAVNPIDSNTMLVGIDVTHPSPGSTKGAPSIACIVASTDSSMFQWPGSIRRQEGRVEMVAKLDEMVDERLALWQKRNSGRLPTKIVIYRDGVSEGQYDDVLKKELPSFETAFEKRYGAKDKWPKVAIIIVGKRHHTRFYPSREEDADYDPKRGKGSWNPLPGTVVDRGIANKVLREFWLQAHQGLQGTARPAHYVVIKDDIAFGADALEQFTHHLCYHFNRATKAVSICPPAYYADLLCERGRAYLFSTLAENHASDSSVFDDAGEWSRDVHPRLRETTWYV
ncbi:hypothetical protein PRZ48_005814 [Zasmidium cellare]|uniref:Piwi-domain-containing protein n=1 Tax=Zasmidium cellare TaxID=395010 RepID=A0ABR0ELD7_ZASCE|nr:hypothetical protein PRZ48_005814 [Zasmidium cellare]